jgi:hypothetical protein
LECGGGKGGMSFWGGDGGILEVWYGFLNENMG